MFPAGPLFGLVDATPPVDPLAGLTVVARYEANAASPFNDQSGNDYHLTDPVGGGLPVIGTAGGQTCYVSDRTRWAVSPGLPYTADPLLLAARVWLDDATTRALFGVGVWGDWDKLACLDLGTNGRPYDPQHGAYTGSQSVGCGTPFTPAAAGAWTGLVLALTPGWSIGTSPGTLTVNGVTRPLNPPQGPAPTLGGPVHLVGVVDLAGPSPFTAGTLLGKLARLCVVRQSYTQADIDQLAAYVGA